MLHTTDIGYNIEWRPVLAFSANQQIVFVGFAYVYTDFDPMLLGSVTTSRGLIG